MELWGRHMGRHWVVNKIVSHLGPDFPLFHDSLFLVPKVISSSNALDLSKRRNIAIMKTKFPWIKNICHNIIKIAWIRNEKGHIKMVKSLPGKIFNYIDYIPVVVECILLFSKSIFCICKGYGKWFLFIFAITNSYRRKPQLLKLHFLMFNLPAHHLAPVLWVALLGAFNPICFDHFIDWQSTIALPIATYFWFVVGGAF